MLFNTFVTSLADLDRCVAAPQVAEVLIEPALLARQGWLSADAAQTLAIAARQRGLRPVLVWDALMPEQRMEQVGDRLQTWDLSPFAALRIADLGAAGWAQQHAPHLPLQLIAEAGNHNLAALQGWCALLGSSLERVILSIELPEDKLMQYCQTLPVACEVLGAGPILLFYSPRPLLSAHLPLADDVDADVDKDSDEDSTETDESRLVRTTVAFEDTRDRPFPSLETPHGTLMFFDKDQFILDRLTPLKTAGLHTLRLDLRPLDLTAAPAQFAAQAGDAAPAIDRLCQQILQDPASIRPQWPRPTRAPFFQANRTTALIPRMKTRWLDPWRPHALAEVIASEKDNYLVFRTLRSFSFGGDYTLLLPTKEVVAFPQSCNPRSLTGAPQAETLPDQLILTHWIKKVVPGSLLLPPDRPALLSSSKKGNPSKK